MELQPISILYDPAVEIFENRNDYIVAVGQQPPPRDPDRPRKTWIDRSAVIGQPYTYLAVNLQTAQLEHMQIPGEWALAPNLDGEYSYPPRPEYDAGGSVIYFPSSRETKAAPHLCEQADAEFLMAELRGFNLNRWRIGSNFEFRAAAGDTRDMWRFNLTSDYWDFAYDLLALRNAHGVGAPGRWVQDKGDPVPWDESDKTARCVWQKLPQYTGEGDNQPDVPVPCRALHDDEKLVKAGIAGISVLVQVGEAEPVPEGGGFTEEDRVTLDECRAILKQYFE